MTKTHKNKENDVLTVKDEFMYLQQIRTEIIRDTKTHKNKENDVLTVKDKLMYLQQIRTEIISDEKIRE